MSPITPHNANCSYCVQVRLSVFVHVIAWSPCSSLAPAIERACVEEIEHLPVSPPPRPATSSSSHQLGTRRYRRGNGDQHIHSEHHQHLLPIKISQIGRKVVAGTLPVLSPPLHPLLLPSLNHPHQPACHLLLYLGFTLVTPWICTLPRHHSCRQLPLPLHSLMLIDTNGGRQHLLEPA